MKLLLRSLLFLFAGQVLPSGTAFVLVPTHPFISRSVIGNRPFAAAVAAAAAVALEPEPPGGIELIASAVSMGSDCRMKQLDVVAEKVSRQQSSADAFTFWMTASAQGKLIQEIRSTILKDASKKANFPGFRKVRQCCCCHRLLGSALKCWTVDSSLLFDFPVVV